jgi:hypothetical protein
VCVCVCVCISQLVEGGNCPNSLLILFFCAFVRVLANLERKKDIFDTFSLFVIHFLYTFEKRKRPTKKVSRTMMSSVATFSSSSSSSSSAMSSSRCRCFSPWSSRPTDRGPYFHAKFVFGRKHLRHRRSSRRIASSAFSSVESASSSSSSSLVREKEKIKTKVKFEVFGADLSASTQYPDVPRERVHWVDTDEKLAVLVGEIRAAMTDDEDVLSSSSSLPGVVLGLDCEWKPGDNTPVSLFQVATRENVYLLDVFAFMMEEEEDVDDGAKGKGTAEAFDAFLKLLFENEKIIKLGFGFDYDIKRLRMSYASLEETLSMDRRKKGWIDVRELAYAADAVSSHNKRKYKHQKRVGLAALTRDVLKCNLDKKCQVSDWSARPLSDPQQRYAATDAYSLISILDVVLFSRGRWKNDEEIADGLQLVQYGGGGSGDGGGIDGRFVKRVSRSKMAKMEKAAFLKRQNSSSLRNARETALHEAKADLTRCVTECLGFACVGRKGAIELLSENGCSVRVPKKTKSKVDNWENAVALFLTVDEPKKTQSAQFRQREDDDSLTLRLENPEKFFSEDAEAYARTKACKSNDGGKSVVLFAKRGSKGKFVFCGRLESDDRNSDGSDSAAASDALHLTLVDGDRLSETPMFFQIIGCHL